MAKQNGWLGLSRFSWPWERDELGARSPGKDALVIAGGGARASFEVGALLYLYEHTDFEPSIVCGTSAGAILAATIAQYAHHDEQLAALRQFEAAWRGMNSADEMFAPRRWYQRLQAILPELQQLVPTAQSLFDDEEGEDEHLRKNAWFHLPQWDVQPFTTRLRNAPRDKASKAVTESPIDVEQESQQPGPDQHFHPLLGFGPENVDDSQQQWTANALWTVLSSLTGLTKFSGDIPAILKGAERTRAAFRPGIILRTLLSPEFFDPQRLATSGVETRLAMTCLETGQLRYMTGVGQLVDRNNEPVAGEEPHDVVMGLLASCSIPWIFAPVPLGKAHYLDGGIRENVPAEMAIGHLGARRPWVIIANPSGVRPDAEAAQGTLIDIAMRCTTILTDECQRDEVAYARSAGAHIIDPEVDVHDSRTVDPGLIDINIAYGWMRGQDIVGQLGEQQVAEHRELTLLRRRCWQLEDRLYNPDLSGIPSQQELADDVTELIAAKFRLRDMVERCSTALPAGAHTWWSTYERHSYEIAKAPIWMGSTTAP